MPAGKGKQRQPGGWEWIASYLLGGVIGGGALGLGGDYLLGTTPLLMVAGVFTGFAAGLYGIYKKV